MSAGGVFDYALGAKGGKASPIELTRRDFSKQVDEGDTVEMANRPRGRNARTVRVLRDGREWPVYTGGWPVTGPGCRATPPRARCRR
jgi:hypothetical protein